MRNPEEIANWLKGQDWYPKFVSNLNTLRKSTGKYHLDGFMGQGTIFTAFHWNASSEGYEFWNNVNDEFMKFYYEGTN